MSVYVVLKPDRQARFCSFIALWFLVRLVVCFLLFFFERLLVLVLAVFFVGTSLAFFTPKRNLSRPCLMAAAVFLKFAKRGVEIESIAVGRKFRRRPRRNPE